MTWEQMERAMEFVTNRLTDVTVKLDELARYVAQDAENIRSLARIAEAPERRIEGLEGGQ